MNYFLWARIIYSLPFLAFLFTDGRSFLEPTSDAFLYAGTWISMFLFSLIFFNLAKKEMPRLLVHFIFIVECFLYYKMSLVSGQESMMLMAFVMSACYAVNCLRNSLFSTGLILLETFVAFLLMRPAFGEIYAYNWFTIIAAPFLCRAVLNTIDERNVEVRTEFIETTACEIVEDSSLIDRLRRKANLFKMKNKKLNEDVLRAKEEAAKNKQQTEAMKDSDWARQEINKEITGKYFALISGIRTDLSAPMSQNIDRILHVYAVLTNAYYVAVVMKEPPAEKGEAYSLSLINSYQANPEDSVSDETVIENETVWDAILSVIKTPKMKYLQPTDISHVSNIILTPIGQDKEVRGVLVQSFFQDGFTDNIHNANLSMIVAHQLFSVMENAALYKQAKDGTNIDPLTGVYNKNFLMRSLPVLFNNAYNYSNNLACAFVGEDTPQDDSGILATKDAILGHVRKTDMVYRCGNNLFVVLFCGVTRDKLEKFTDEINTNLAENPTTISVSIGASIYDPVLGDKKNGEELVSSAAQALKAAKQSRESGQFYFMP